MLRKTKEPSPLDMPKKAKLSAGEEVYLKKLTQKTGIASIVIWEIAKKERVPVTSIIILGGNPFIDVSGLDRKIRNKRDDEKLIIKEITARLIQSASKDNDHLARAEGIIKYFDKISFNKAIEKLESGTLTKEVIEKLEQVYTETYTDVGEASPDSCKAIAYTYKKVGEKKEKDKLLVENIDMMAARRASSRAKRSATGCGLTSLDEVPMVDAYIASQVQDQRKATKEQLAHIEELKINNLFKKSETSLIEQRIGEIKKDRPDKKLTEGDAADIIKGIESMISSRTETKGSTETKESTETKQGELV